MTSIGDQTVLITGATSGIGYHTALHLAREGAEVLITGRDQSTGESATASLREQAGHDRIHFHPADHSTIDGNRRLADQIAMGTPRLDVLINNVGQVFSTRQETADGYEATLALCFLGPYTLTNNLLETLRGNPQPRIVNVVSSAYKMWHGDPFDDIQSRERYVAIRAHARAKLLNLIWTFALAEQLGDGAAVNATNPGMAWTNGTAALTRQAVPAWRYIWPLVRFFQRRASPEKASGTPAWLAGSPETAKLTGVYVEKRRTSRPAIAIDRENQQRTLQLAQDLTREYGARQRS
jgi:retinol dehydrogenase-12